METGENGAKDPSQAQKEAQLDNIINEFNGGKPATPAEDKTPPTQDPPADNNAPEDYKTKFEQLQAEHTNAVAEANRYKELAEADPFNGDVELKTIHELKKKGATTDSAIQYIKTDLEKLSPFEKKVLSLQLATPGVSKEKLEKYVKLEYKLGEYAPKQDDGETPDEQDGLDRLEIEVAQAGGINERLQKQKEELLTQAAKPRSEVEASHAQQQLGTEWGKEIPAINNTLKGFEVKVEGIDAPVKIALAGYGPEKVQEYIDRVVAGGHKLTPENVKFVETQILKDAYYENREKIALEIAKAANGKLEAKTYDELHHPSSHQPPPGGGAVKKTKEEELDFALKNMR